MKKMFNGQEAAEILGVNRQTMATWRHLRKGPNYHKMGSKIAYSEEDLQKFIDSRLVTLDEA